MTGADLRQWRKLHGYTQETLRLELDLGSRQTIISWEKSAETLPRTIVLALHALSEIPNLKNVSGHRMPSVEQQDFRRRIENL